MMLFQFDELRLRASAKRYVESGPAVTKALRQQEADSALAFLLSPSAADLRVPAITTQSPPCAGYARPIAETR